MRERERLFSERIWGSSYNGVHWMAAIRGLIKPLG